MVVVADSLDGIAVAALASAGCDAGMESGDGPPFACRFDVGERR